jgi:UDP-glucose 4-epimerase
MSLGPRSVVVIGAGGVVGKLLLTRLRDDPNVKRVIACGTTKPTGLRRRTPFVELDLANPDSVVTLAEHIDKADIDTLVYMGYLADDGVSTEKHRVEVSRLIDTLERRSVPKAIFASTTAVYGPLEGHSAHLSETTPLPGETDSEWVNDKLEAERMLSEYAEVSDSVISVLRFALVLGPTVSSFMTTYLAQRSVPTLRDLDPPLQFIHEEDVAGAIHHAIKRDGKGPFNIVGDGALPLSIALRMGRRRSAPVPRSTSGPLSRVLWEGQSAEVPPILMDLFRYIWVADGSHVTQELGYHPDFSSKETLEAFYRARAQA